jgi:hypothetical protein
MIVVPTIILNGQLSMSGAKSSSFLSAGNEGGGAWLPKNNVSQLKGPLLFLRDESYNKGRFAHETESPCPLHFKHSHRWKRRSRSKFASHYAWGTNGVCECKMDVKSTWISTWHQMDSWSLGLFSKTTFWRQVQHKIGRPWHSECSQPLIYSFCYVWESVWIEIHWNAI